MVEELLTKEILQCYQIMMKSPQPPHFENVCESWCHTYQKYFRYHEPKVWKYAVRNQYTDKQPTIVTPIIVE